MSPASTAGQGPTARGFRAGEVARALLSIAGLCVFAGLLVFTTARPVVTDDAWWHLAFGQAYLSQGPWLAGDPLLFAAPGPPAPASWLFDAALALIWHATGFAGLRALHGLALLATLALAWWLLRRESGSTVLACLGTAAFGALSAYRIFQLRPELFTIAATLALYGWLIAPRADRRTPHTVALSAALGTLWANQHAGFLLGPILLGVAAAGLAGAILIHGPHAPEVSWHRVRQLAAALVANVLGSLVNPSGPGVLLPYLRAGDSTPSLTQVYDEWAPLTLLQLPVRDLTPTPFDWLLLWGLLLVTLVIVAWWALRGRQPDSAARRIDPALVAVACASWVAMATAVRFMWLALFPILLLAAIGRVLVSSRDRAFAIREWTGVLLTSALIPCFMSWGIWSLLARGVPQDLEGYSAPYSIAKHPGHSTWLLRDAGLTGRLFAGYYSGGFLGFWLSPALRAMVNGTLNVPPEVMQAYMALQSRYGVDDATFEETLEDQDLDLFLGWGLPGYHPTRPRVFTINHPERTESWILVFRNFRESLWLRDHPRNTANFERIERYYAEAGVPFDRDRGFEVKRVLREALDWARRHALVPVSLDAIERAASQGAEGRRTVALGRLAQIYLALGLYEEALSIDSRVLAGNGDQRGALRRSLWCLLHLDRTDEALAIADRLEAISRPDSLGNALATAARRYSEEDDPEGRAGQVARLPLFSRDQASRLSRGYSPPTLPTDRP